MELVSGDVTLGAVISDIDLGDLDEDEYSQSCMGHTDTSTGACGFDVKDAPLRSLVKNHPETGPPELFIGRPAYGVTGLSTGESEALLDRLLIEACQLPRLLDHSWSVGDLVLWDNRSVLHRARPYNPDELRVMHHSRVAGDPITEAGLDPNPAA